MAAIASIHAADLITFARVATEESCLNGDSVPGVMDLVLSPRVPNVLLKYVTSQNVNTARVDSFDSCDIAPGVIGKCVKPGRFVLFQKYVTGVSGQLTRRFGITVRGVNKP